MIPVTVIGGYLGAGKTTLVNHALRHADGQRLAVLVNEFGDLPIDADLIEAQDDEIIAIAGGCICCSFGSSLIDAMQKMIALDPTPDHILIESSGVALPGSIASSLSLLEGVTLSGIVVLADAETIRSNGQDKYLSDTITRQLAQAELVLLTKGDLVELDILDDVEKWVAHMAPTASIIRADHGRIPNDLLLGPHEGQRENLADDHRASQFASRTFELNRKYDVHGLAEKIATGNFGVTRAKGHVCDADGIPHLIQIVGQRFRVEKKQSNHPNQLVCIGVSGKIDFDALRALLVKT